METEGKVKKILTKQQYVEKTLRRGCYAWPARTNAMKASWVRRGVYLCNHCRRECARKEITMDHVLCVADVRGLVDWNEIIHRMFVEENGWMVLCSPCHQIKTNIENDCRRTIRFALKKMESELQKYYEEIK